MSSSAGRRSAAYVAARTEFKTGRYPCWLNTGAWCTGIGTTVEHDPPLTSAPSPELWRGVFRPACKPCQDRQGANLVNQRRRTPWRW